MALEKWDFDLAHASAPSSEISGAPGHGSRA